MKKASFPHCVRERGIKQRYARFSAGGIALHWNSSTCCLKNSMIILPQTRGVVKYFFEDFYFPLLSSPAGGADCAKAQTERF